MRATSAALAWLVRSALAFPVEIAGKLQRGRELSLDIARFIGVSRRPQFGAQLLDVALDREGLREHRRLLCLKDDVGGRA